MRPSDYIFMAFRNIRRQKLRSVLTIFAVVIGAMSITVMLAAVFSIKGFMTKQFEANGTFQQVAVSPQTDITWNNQSGGGNDCPTCAKLTDPLVNQIKARPHVIGISRRAQVNGFDALVYGSQKLKTYNLTAYDTNGIIVDHVLAGRDIGASDTSGVVTITSDYADKLGFQGNYQALVGKSVGLQAQGFYNGVGTDPVKQSQQQQAWFQAHPGVDGRDYQPPPITLAAKIVGVTDPTDQSYQIRVPLAWAHGLDENQNYQPAQQMCSFNAPCRSVPPKLTVEDELAKNGYDSLIVKVDQSSNAAAVAKDIRNKFKVGAADAQTEIKQQLAIFNILGLVLGGIGGIALVVAAVGVVNTMIMSILERTREIGVMRAVGARRSAVSRLFTFEAALLSFFGGVVGLGLGYVVVLIANPILNKQLKSNNIGSSNIVTLPVWLIVGVIALTTVIGILAGLYPARRAAKLDPVKLCITNKFSFSQSFQLLS